MSTTSARDRLGLDLSAPRAAAEAYVEGVDRLLAAWPGAEQRLERSLGEAPDFALAHAAQARMLQMYGRNEAARGAAERARAFASRATPRERGHVEAVALVVEGQPGPALIAVERQLDAYPRDAVVLSLALGAFGLLAFSGRADHDQARLALCKRLAPEYGDDWWFLTFLGWAHTEAGELERGRRITERSIELRRENAHGAHALAHSHLERGEAEEGIAQLDGWLPDYDRSGQLFGHLCWHRALLDLERGDVERALRVYRDLIRPGVSLAPPINVLTDGVSLLWRVGLSGDQRVLPWHEQSSYARETYPAPSVPFIEIHWAIAAAAAGDSDALNARLDALRARAASGRSNEVTTALCEALDAFIRDAYDQAIWTLAPILGEIVRIGGSHAQRELVEDTLIVACLRAGRARQARELIESRLRRRPSRRDRLWLEQAGADGAAVRRGPLRSPPPQEIRE